MLVSMPNSAACKSEDPGVLLACIMSPCGVFDFYLSGQDDRKNLEKVQALRG